MRIKVKLESVQRAARSRAPYTAILYYVGGQYARAVLRSQLLRSIVACPFLTHAEIILTGDDPTGLRLSGRNGHRRADYALRVGSGLNYAACEEQERWAVSQRKRRTTLAMLPADRFTRRLTEAVAKLKRQAAKLQPGNPPIHPLLHRADYIPYTPSEAHRASALAWVRQHPVRHSLAKLAARKWKHDMPKTWGDFYAAVSAITGENVSEYATYAKAHGRKRYCHYNGATDYPGHEQYLTHLPAFLHLADKPYDFYAYDPYGIEREIIYQPIRRRNYLDVMYKAPAADPEPGRETTRFQRHREAQIAYLIRRREYDAVMGQIAQHEAEIDAYNATRQHAEYVEHLAQDGANLTQAA